MNTERAYQLSENIVLRTQETQLRLYIKGEELLNTLYTNAAAATRDATFATLRHLLVAEVQKSQGLVEAEKHLQTGNPLLILPNHFSQFDPAVTVGYIAFANETMQKRRMVIPVAHHQLPSFGKWLAKYGVNVDLMPIVTKETMARPRYQKLDHKGNPRFKVNDGLVEYAAKAIEVLENSGIALLTFQGTRQATLPETPQNTAVSMMVAKATRAGIKNLGFLFVGVGINGVEDYGDEKYAHFNIRKPFRLKVGAFVKQNEALRQAGSLRGLDGWVLSQLKPIVPTTYLPKKPLDK